MLTSQAAISSHSRRRLPLHSLPVAFTCTNLTVSPTPSEAGQAAEPPFLFLRHHFIPLSTKGICGAYSELKEIAFLTLFLARHSFLTTFLQAKHSPCDLVQRQRIGLARFVVDSINNATSWVARSSAPFRNPFLDPLGCTPICQFIHIPALHRYSKVSGSWLLLCPPNLGSKNMLLLPNYI